MSEAIYATADMPEQVKYDRSEFEERCVDIYVSADTVRGHDPSPRTEDPTPRSRACDQLSGNTHVLVYTYRHVVFNYCI